MDHLSFPQLGKIDSLGLLFTLLPGLLTYLIFRALSARGEKIDAVEAVLDGLAYTLVVHALWFSLKQLGSWIPTPDLLGLSLTAVGLGLSLATVYNSGTGYRMLRRLRLTGEPSWLTIWETAFREFRGVQKGEYAVLHLNDGRRVMGAIRGFSSQQKKGHVCLARVRWFSGTEASEEHPGLHLFNAGDICVVEFLPPEKGATYALGQAQSSPTATATAAGPGQEHVVRSTKDGPTTSSAASTTSSRQDEVAGLSPNPAASADRKAALSGR
ncbi:MAG TPA: DUF6338 family protein [Thermoanaerobaculia bacterium]|jgi:hypothetical protein|nr:DUF6338 family protein [Thermoanaerobaculia bacterium]